MSYEKTKSQEKTKEVLKQLEEGVRDVFESERFKEYLRFVARFHNYSYSNTLLIMQQRQGATRVAGYNAWKEMGRHVKKGEKGIVILAPSFRSVKRQVTDKDGQAVTDEKGEPVTEAAGKQLNRFFPVHVFDVSQTDGKPVPELAPPLEGEVKDFKKVFRALEGLSPYPVRYGEMNDGAHGYCDYAKQEIVLSDKNSRLQTIKTLVHELAHARLHHKDHTGADLKSKSDKEIEAESVAYAVSQRLGLDTGEYSFDYIANWSKDKETSQLKAALGTIARETDAIIAQFDIAVRERGQEQGRDL